MQRGITKKPTDKLKNLKYWISSREDSNESTEEQNTGGTNRWDKKKVK